MFGVQGLNQYLCKLLAGTCTMEGMLMLCKYFFCVTNGHVCMLHFTPSAEYYLLMSIYVVHL
jgi:hypothetical protein